MRKKEKVQLVFHEGLPEICYSTLPYSGKLVILKRGIRAFSMCYDQSSSAAKNRRAAIAENKRLGISKAQVAAMIYGARFGFDNPEADPKNYDKRGNLLPIQPEPERGSPEIRER